MRFRTAQPHWLWGAVVGSALVSAGCGDDTVASTDTESGTGTGTESTSTTESSSSTTDVLPTTTSPTTPTSTTDETTSSTSTTEAITSSTTDDSTSTTEPSTSTSTSTGPDTDTDTDTETTGGALLGQTQSQFVNAGNVSTSPNFRMVYTLGQPTTHQDTYSSPNFRLHGGLIGANGSPP